MGKRFCGKACRVKNKREIIQLPAVGFIRRPGACFLQGNVVQWRKEIRRRTAMIQIRRAVDKDIPRLHELLGQVLQIHAEIAPGAGAPDSCGDSARYFHFRDDKVHGRGTSGDDPE